MAAETAKVSSAKAHENPGSQPKESQTKWGEVKTIFLRCRALRSRGDLVNHFLFQYREELGIQDWYTENNLNFNAPLEIVHVKNSRKPFFLVEVRLPFPEELGRRKKGITPVEGGDFPEQKMPKCADALTASDTKRLEVSKALMTLGESVKEYKGESVSIAAASNHITVREERRKLEERESSRKREREAECAPAELKRKETLISFVPRAVRRQA